jgi:uncharacterized repeat protein (TIGR03837 family)
LHWKRQTSDDCQKKQHCDIAYTPAMPLAEVHVVCRVVDNFGDAGICFRLARQLAAEHGLAATLWIDDLARLACLAPEVDPTRSAQQVAGLRVRRLRSDSPALEALPDLVIEGFGCGLPPSWLDAMAAAAQPPLWINLEYLSAEAWVDGAHALPSRHPRLPLTRWFWFPGFGAATGGLLRERDLLSRRDRFRADARAQAALWTALGLAAPTANEIAVSLFSYHNPVLPDLFAAWSRDQAPLRVVVPEGIAGDAVATWAGDEIPTPGKPVARGALTVAVTPFVSQDEFDRRLWACDLLIVRGEDSFVRAQWAGRPFVWQAYPQAEDAHLAKVEAFLGRYLDGVAASATAALKPFWRAFNDRDPAAATRAWPGLRAALPELGRHAIQWADRHARLPDLASRLIDFAASRL